MTRLKLMKISSKKRAVRVTSERKAMLGGAMKKDISRVTPKVTTKRARIMRMSQTLVLRSLG